MASNLQTAPRPASRWALTGLSLCLLLASLGTSIVNVALPTLADAFAAPFARVQWVVLAYLLAITATIVAAGRLGDALGRRRVLLAGIAVFIAASLACAFAPTLGVLVVARAVQGVGAAVMTALALAFVADTVPKAKAGSAMGWLGTMSALGTALRPALGGVLAARFGWPSLFVAGVPAAVLAMGLVARRLPAIAASPRPAPFDVAGTVLLAAALAAYSLAMTAASFDVQHVLLLLVAIVSAWGFVRVELRAAAPLLRMALLREPVLAAGSAMSILVTTVVMATLVVGPFYLARGLGLDTAHIGTVMAAGPVVAALAGVPAGRIVDRIGARRSTTAGLLTMALGAVLLALVPGRCGVAGYASALGVLTAGYAWFQAANNTAVMTGAPQGERGVISGVLNLARNLGLVTGASAMGTVFAAAVGGNAAAAAPHAAEHGMRITFAVGALLLVVAMGIARASAARSPAAAACAACNDAAPR
ncbi:MAG: MFS transporter [Burkholderiales bacterium]